MRRDVEGGPAKPVFITGYYDQLKPVGTYITRPADTTAYTAGDVVGQDPAVVMEFFDVVQDGDAQPGYILDALLIDSANQATKPSLELWLFSQPPAAVADNSPFAPTDAELDHLEGIIVFNSTAFVGTATSGAGGNSVQVPADNMSRGIMFKCKDGRMNLYGVLVVRNAYAPVSGEKFTVKLKVMQG